MTPWLQRQREERPRLNQLIVHVQGQGTLENDLRQLSCSLQVSHCHLEVIVIMECWTCGDGELEQLEPRLPPSAGGTHRSMVVGQLYGPLRRARWLAVSAVWRSP